jgi:hypothetical protein
MNNLVGGGKYSFYGEGTLLLFPLEPEAATTPPITSPAPPSMRRVFVLSSFRISLGALPTATTLSLVATRIGEPDLQFDSLPAVRILSPWIFITQPEGKTSWAEDDLPIRILVSELMRVSFVTGLYWPVALIMTVPWIRLSLIFSSLSAAIASKEKSSKIKTRI